MSKIVHIRNFCFTLFYFIKNFYKNFFLYFFFINLNISINSVKTFNSKSLISSKSLKKSYFIALNNVNYIFILFNFQK